MAAPLSNPSYLKMLPIEVMAIVNDLKFPSGDHFLSPVSC